MITKIRMQSAAIENLCKRFHVRRLELFGSAATGKPGQLPAELDFLAEFDPLRPVAYADAYFGFSEELEELLHRNVEVVVAGAVKNPYLRESIQKSRTLLYPASIDEAAPPGKQVGHRS